MGVAKQLSLLVLIGITNVNCQICDQAGIADNALLTCGDTVSQPAYTSLNAVGGGACTDAERNKLLCGFVHFTTDAAGQLLINSPLTECVNEDSMKCACLNQVGSELTRLVSNLCLAAITVSDYTTAGSVTGSANSYSCTGAQILNVCGSTFVAINGGYSNWGNWGSCGPCDANPGTQTRTRTCTNPSPANNGTDCSGLGNTSESQNCVAASCPSGGSATTAAGGNSGGGNSGGATTTAAAGGGSGNNGANVVSWCWSSLFVMIGAFFYRMK